jgi:PAS domain S-box-containing protein
MENNMDSGAPTPEEPESAETLAALDNEERVRFALESARIGVWEWDLASDRVKCSSTWAFAFKVRPEDVPTTGRAFFKLVHPDDRQSLGEATEKAMRDRTDLVTEFRSISSDGATHWVEVHGRVACDTDGKPVRVLGVNINISDRKSLEDTLREARDQAERLRTLKATMRTVQDIVGNALMSLQAFRFDAEPYVPSASLEGFDRIIGETAAKLKALGDLDHVVETDMVMGTGIEYRSTSARENP